eukprot:scaffold4390_cov264-Pinguiococcus_pyrenoidosus.AAC.4
MLSLTRIRDPLPSRRFSVPVPLPVRRCVYPICARPTRGLSGETTKRSAGESEGDEVSHSGACPRSE